jgi:hypothetical protein
VRLIHSLEILADSLVYAGALVWLLTNHRDAWQQRPHPHLSQPLIPPVD